MNTEIILQVVNGAFIIVVGLMVWSQRRNLKIQSQIINDFKTYHESFSISKIKEATEHLLKGDLQKEKFEFEHKLKTEFEQKSNTAVEKTIEVFTEVANAHGNLLCTYLSQKDRRSYIEKHLPNVKNTFFIYFAKYEAEHEGDADQSLQATIERQLLEQRKFIREFRYQPK